MIKNTNKLRLGIMLDNNRLETWQYNMLAMVIKSDYASPKLIIINKNRNTNTGSEPIRSSWKNICYIAYTRLEKRITHHKLDASALIDSLDVLEDIPKIEVHPRTDGGSDCVRDDEVTKIKEFQLDVIVQCGSRDLNGAILKAAKYGIWSYHHSDDTAVRGGPSGFWETFERRGERGAGLHILTGDGENGIVLCRSFLGCGSHFVSKNNNSCSLRSSFFVPRSLKKLYNFGGEAFFNRVMEENKKLNVYNYPLYSVPANSEFLPMFIKHVCRMGMNHLKFQFYHNQWVLLYDFGDTISTSFWRFKKMVPPGDRFWADPHVLFRDGIYYIFIEEYPFKTKKGHISVIEMHQSGKYSEPVNVLEEPFHLSYPHIFETDGRLFMIPETQQAHSINLYECTDFPYGWEHRETLIDSVDAVDSTILFHNNKWWLFTNISEPEGIEEFNELFLFCSDTLISRDWHGHPMNPVVSDVKRARSAGKILNHNGSLYRPSQCGIPDYGYGIKLNEILTLTENDYREREINCIEPKWDKKLKGVHTLCHEKQLTMIDGYYQHFFL